MQNISGRGKNPCKDVRASKVRWVSELCMHWVKTTTGRGMVGSEVTATFPKISFEEH